MNVTDGDLVEDILNAAGWMVHKNMIIDKDGGDLNVWYLYVAVKESCPEVINEYGDSVCAGTELSALEAIRNIEMARQGLFWITSEGDARWESRFYRIKNSSPVATFDNNMLEDAGITYELSDRLIYNDIRSQVTVTKTREVVVTTWVPATEPDEKTNTAQLGLPQFWGLWGDGETRSGSTYIPCKIEQVVSMTAECSYWAGSNYIWVDVPCTWALKSSVATMDYVSITMVSPYAELQVSVIHLIYTERPEAGQGEFVDTITIEEYQEILTVYAEDANSIHDYGRRTMNLTWPLGETQEVTQAIANSYLAKYKDPRPTSTVTFIPKNDTLLAQLLNRTISDCINIKCDRINLDADFFIDKVDFRWKVGQPPTITWNLSLVKEIGIWILGVSKLGTETVLRT